MDDFTDEFDVNAMMRAAFRLPRGRARVEAIRRVVHATDRHGDVQMAFLARQRLLDEAYYTGDQEDIFVEFCWLVGQVRNHPDLFSMDDILWKYKWVVENIHEFPDITQAQIDAVFLDFETSMREAGYSLRPLYQYRALYGEVHDERELVEASVAEWHKHPRDRMADCRACEANHELTALAYLGRHEEALREAKPILDGRVTCAEIPHITHATLLRSYMYLGRWDDARQANAVGERLLKDNAGFVWELGEHMIYHCLVGHPEAALQQLERSLGLASTASKQYGRCHYYTAAQMALAATLKTGVDTLPLRLPREFPLYQAEATYSVQALHDWFAEQAMGLAERFDRRHGHRVFRDKLAADLDLGKSLHPPGL